MAALLSDAARGRAAVAGQVVANAERSNGVGIGASGTIYFSSDIENAIYKVTKK